MADQAAPRRHPGITLCRRGNAARWTAAGSPVQPLPRFTAIAGNRTGAGQTTHRRDDFCHQPGCTTAPLRSGLYGRALYTSSVLIGLYWISIIAILTLTYWLLYQFTARLEAGKSAWWVGLTAWVLAGFIARLLSTNMTLMLRPEVWREMYAASGAGAYLPTGDPTLEPRWLLMLAGGFFISGLWLIYLAGRSTFTAQEKQFVSGLGGKIAAGFGIVYLAAGLWAASVQPEVVKLGLATHPLYKWFGFEGYGWLALVAVAILLALYAGFVKASAGVAGILAWAAVLIAVLTEIMFTVYRDAVRDLTLLSKGYDVWDRAVATNWWVVGLFLLLFVAGLGVIGWLVSVVARARKVMEAASV